MENIEKVAPGTEPVETTQVETKVDKTFTQEEVNNIVKSRVSKERDTFAKDLGLGERFDKDAFNNYVSGYNSNKETVTALQSEVTKYSETVQNQEKTILQYKYDIKEDSYDKVMALANIEIGSNNEITIDEALAKVLTEVPSFTNKVTTVPDKVGAETVNNTKVDPNPYITDQLQKQYPWLKK